MKLLISLFFKSEHGGLHDNVYATAVEAKYRGHDVYVACRKGEFLDKIKNSGIKGIEIDLSNEGESVRKILEATDGKIDLIHVHPGKSREICMKISALYDIPVILHVHGKWTDQLHMYIDKVSGVFAVSEGIKQKIVEECRGYAHKVHVIPNYSDFELLEHASRKVSASPRRKITCISRLDRDKQLIINSLKEAVEFLNSVDDKYQLDIIGDGTEKESLMEFMSENITNPNINVNFLGWIADEKILKEMYLESDIIIGPGRVAIDAMKLKIPTIVVGSQSYLGIIKKANWQEIHSTNYGGLNIEIKTKRTINEDLEELMGNSALRRESVHVGNLLSVLFLDETSILKKHFGLYELIRK